MLDLEDYKKINLFKDKIHKHHFLDTEAKSFRERTAISLGEEFGYQHVIYGYIDTPKNRGINFDVALHNIDMEFAQRFLTSNFIQDKGFYDKRDVVVFSDTASYQKRTIYKELIINKKFSDFMLFYLKVQGDYVGYIIVFKETSQKIFTDKDKEIAESIRDFLAVEYFNYISFLSLKSANDRLITQTNYYPIGIIIMKNYHDVTFANETAKEYISELELGNIKFFSMFYNNHILPHVKFELSRSGKRHTIRHKDFLFSVVNLNPLTESFTVNVQKQSFANLMNLTPEIITYIYMLKDELSSYSKGREFFADYAFTKKEEQIIELILRGKNNKQIADEIEVSVNTVRVHMQNIYKKTGVNNRTEFLFKMNNV